MGCGVSTVEAEAVEPAAVLAPDPVEVVLVKPPPGSDRQGTLALDDTAPEGQCRPSGAASSTLWGSIEAVEAAAVSAPDPTRPKVSIRARNVIGKEATILISPRATLAQLQTQLHVSLGLPPCRQRLMIREKEMMRSPDTPICECDFPADDVLIVASRPPAAGRSASPSGGGLSGDSVSGILFEHQQMQQSLEAEHKKEVEKQKQRVQSRRGSMAAQAQPLVTEQVQQPEAQLSVAAAPEVQQAAAQHQEPEVVECQEPEVIECQEPEVVDWSDLMINPYERGNFVIPDTAKRAITLEQLELIVAHICRRVRGPHKWCRAARGARVSCQLSDPKEVNLYDLNKKVILPCTDNGQTSMVEFMTDVEQPPDYFTSHFWGEPVLQMVLCLKQHCHDRALMSPTGYKDGIGYGGTQYENKFDKPHPGYLGGRAPRYWICAYANRQGDLTAEICVPLEQTSFVRAIQLCKGTVSVLDHGGVVYTRIWCIYEQFQSLLVSDAQTKKNYTYDIARLVGRLRRLYRYTALDFTVAVGITDGKASVDRTADNKERRERSFPLRLIDQGLTLECRKAQASRSEDLARIISAIGDKHELLDSVLHGVVAIAGLRSALEACHATELYSHGVFSQDLLMNSNLYNELNLVTSENLVAYARNAVQLRAQYLEALRKGQVRRFNLDLKGTCLDDTDLEDVVSTLDPETLTHLTINRAYSQREYLCPLTQHVFHQLTILDLSFCEGLERLPEGLWKAIPNIKVLDIQGCNKLRQVPKGMKVLKELKNLYLTHATFCPCKANENSLTSDSHIHFPQEDLQSFKKQGCIIDCGVKVYKA